MIGSDRAAADLVARVSSASEARMSRDFAQLEELAAREWSGGTVEPWDSPYLQERVKQERHDVDARQVRRYFEYGRVKQGVLRLVGRLFGVEFRAVADAPSWHPEVDVLDVFEGERPLGRVYLDMHPREGKYKHYAQFTLASGVEGGRLPEGALVCNFPRPGAEPALLEHDEVRTFLHELGTPAPPRPRRAHAVRRALGRRDGVGLRRGALADARGVGLGSGCARRLRAPRRDR